MRKIEVAPQEVEGKQPRCHFFRGNFSIRCAKRNRTTNSAANSENVTDATRARNRYVHKQRFKLLSTSPRSEKQNHAAGTAASPAAATAGGRSKGGLITQVDKNADKRGGVNEEDSSLNVIRAIKEPKGPLLGPISREHRGKKTLVLDLDETLVHSSFQPVPVAAFVMPIEIEGVQYDVYVAKRPGVEEFLEFCAELYEVVIFTASLSKYADPLVDRLDPNGDLVPWRLFREHCLAFHGNYIKDLARLGRDIRDVIIVDNSPTSSILQPDNSIPIKSWFDDVEDTELYDLMPILRALASIDDIPRVLRRTLALDVGGES